jgi:Flp pilus assembly protein TadD
LDSVNIHALHNRGISHERLSQYKDAIKDFSKVIAIDPANANAYFNRGCCYDTIGELDLAISDYSVALELDLHSGAEDDDKTENSNLFR